MSKLNALNIQKQKVDFSAFLDFGIFPSKIPINHHTCISCCTVTVLCPKERPKEHQRPRWQAAQFSAGNADCLVLVVVNSDTSTHPRPHAHDSVKNTCPTFVAESRGIAAPTIGRTVCWTHTHGQYVNLHVSTLDSTLCFHSTVGPEAVLEHNCPTARMLEWMGRECSNVRKSYEVGRIVRIQHQPHKHCLVYLSDVFSPDNRAL